jgi:adenylate cyclase
MPPPIEKVRCEVEYGGLCWEVDEFLGQNRGLLLAEVELTAADQPFERPAWVGEEVTHDPRYFNSQLAAHPYATW